MGKNEAEIIRDKKRIKALKNEDMGKELVEESRPATHNDLP
jgi:hypothetical protein